MKLQKSVAIWSGIISALSLFFSYIFYRLNMQFVSGVLVGLFSSGILIFLTSIVTFHSEREKELIALFLGCNRFLSSMIKGIKRDKTAELYQLKENLDAMVGTYNSEVFLHVDHLEILCHKSKAYLIVCKIWHSAATVYNLILDDQDVVMKYILGDSSEHDLYEYKWKHCNAESVEQINQLHSALDELADYLHYFEHIENGKRKRKEALKDAD